MRLDSRIAKSGLRYIYDSLHTNLWDRNIRGKGLNYLFQCGLATLSLIVIFVVEDALLNAAIVVAVASTAFIIFVIPNSIAATPRKVIGGHLVAVIVGTAFSLVLQMPILETFTAEPRILFDVLAAICVGVSILVMVVTNSEHPPAAGTALGLIIQDSSWAAVGFILVSAILLSLLRIILRPKLIDLL